jgi:hypothetical protein
MNEIIQKIEGTLDKYTLHVYMFSLFLLHLSYFLVFVRVINYDAMIVNYINIFIQLFICIVLIIRFNPIRKIVLKEYDRYIIFGSALFLLANLGLTQFFKNYFEKIFTNFTKRILA